jgi:hypothetical protein
MAQTNERILQDKIAGTSALDLGGQATVNKMFDIGYSVTLAASIASGTVAATHLWSNPFDFPVLMTSVEVNPGAAVAFDATNFAVLAITVDDGAATTAVAAGSFMTNAVNWASKIDLAATLNLANCVVAAGANVFYTLTKNGAGVVTPSTALKARFRRL